MKVQPGKKKVNPTYKKNTNVVKTVAALSLTTSTLVSLSACNTANKVGKFIKNDIKDSFVPVETDIVLAGEAIEGISVGYAITKDPNGTLVTPEFSYGYGDTFYTTYDDCIVINNGSWYGIVYGISKSEIEEDSEFSKEFNDEYFDIYNIDGGILIIEKDADYYIEYTLAGDVAMEDES